jgi:hypothetical protein
MNSCLNLSNAATVAAAQHRQSPQLLLQALLQPQLAAATVNHLPLLLLLLLLPHSCLHHLLLGY